MSELVFENDIIKILANNLGVQISKKDGTNLRWVQYETFFKMSEDIESLKQQLDKFKWRPIESAPIGKWVLIGINNSHPTFVDREYVTADLKDIWLKSKKENYERISHWMPLPEAPKEISE